MQNKCVFRTSATLTLLSHMWLIHIIVILSAVFLFVFVIPQSYVDDELWNLSCFWKLGWLFPLPYTIICFLGLVLPFRITKQRDEWDEDKEEATERSFRNFYIVTVTKGNNREAVMRSWNAHKQLQKLHPGIHVHILTDEPFTFPDLPCFTCPTAFETEHSTHKARALEWYRQKMMLSDEDWILHLDEESVVDEYTVRACLDFIWNGEHLWGQGVILYNQWKYFSNWFYTVADGIRVADDVARFHLQYTFLHRPIFGAHGSFLLVNGKVENEITWDLGSLTEDYQFAVSAWDAGYTCGKISGIVREQSPMDFSGFMKQRRRWYVGIRRLPGILPKLWALFWTAGSFTLYATIASVVLGFIWQYPTPRWMGLLKDFQFCTFIYLYVLGIFIQDVDSGVSVFLALCRIPLVIILALFSTVLECMAIMYAIVCPPKSFDVINK